MPWTDWKFPSANSLVSAGDESWTNPNNAHADDGSSATVTIGQNESSDVRRWTGFGFTTDDIPSGAEILGIEVDLYWDGTNTVDGFTGYLQLFDASNGASAQIRQMENPVAFVNYNLGGAGSLWGESSISASDVRASTFGVQFHIDSQNFGVWEAFVDYIRVRAYYRAASTGVANSVPVIESFTSANSGGEPTSSLVLTEPAGAGGSLLLIAGCDGALGDPEEYFRTPSGWNPINVFGSGSESCRLGAWIIPEASGSEGNVTLNFYQNKSQEVYGWYIRLSGVDTSDPIDSVSFGTSDSDSHSIPGLTTERANCQLLYALAFDGGDGNPFGQPTGWAEQDEENSGTNSNDAAGVWGSKTKSVAGTEGSAVVSSLESDGAVTMMLALKPSQSFGPQITSMNTVLGINIDFLNDVAATNLDFINGVDV